MQCRLFGLQEGRYKAPGVSGGSEVGLGKTQGLAEVPTYGDAWACTRAQGEGIIIPIRMIPCAGRELQPPPQGQAGMAPGAWD